MPRDPNEPNKKPRGVSRRQFLRGAGLVGVGTTLSAGLLLPEEAGAEPSPSPDAPGGQTFHKDFQPLTLNVNGQEVKLQVQPRTTLLNALRNHAVPPITGPKLVCDEGACGACTVLVDGRTAYACLLLAMDMAGRKIVTVEGLGAEASPGPVQTAFVEKDALMCGFCTPGFVTSVAALLQTNPNPTLADVQRACAGNVCRCGTYPRVFEAALDAAKKMRGGA